MFSKIRVGCNNSCGPNLLNSLVMFIQEFYGSGLICNDTLTGILTKKCVSDRINVYTNVVAYREWIAEKLSEKSCGSISSMFATATLFGIYFGTTKVSEILIN